MTLGQLIQIAAAHPELDPTLEVKIQPGRASRQEWIEQTKRGLLKRMDVNTSGICKLRILLVTPKPYILLTTSAWPILPNKAEAKELEL